MKTFTISVDDETYRRASRRATEQGTSIPALIEEFLESMAVSAPSGETLSEVIKSIRAQVGGIDSRDNVSRAELHDRCAIR